MWSAQHKLLALYRASSASHTIIVLLPCGGGHPHIGLMQLLNDNNIHTHQFYCDYKGHIPRETRLSKSTLTSWTDLKQIVVNFIKREALYGTNIILHAWSRGTTIAFPIAEENLKNVIGLATFAAIYELKNKGISCNVVLYHNKNDPYSYEISEKNKEKIGDKANLVLSIIDHSVIRNGNKDTWPNHLCHEFVEPCFQWVKQLIESPEKKIQIQPQISIKKPKTQTERGLCYYEYTYDTRRFVDLNCISFNYSREYIQTLDPKNKLQITGHGYLSFLINSSERDVHEAKLEIMTIIGRLRGTVPYFSTRFAGLRDRLKGMTLTKNIHIEDIIQQIVNSIYDTPQTIKVQEKDVIQYEGIIADIMALSFFVEIDLISKCMSKLNENINIEKPDQARIRKLNSSWNDPSHQHRKIDILNFKRNIRNKTIEQLFDTFTAHIDNMFEHFIFYLCHSLAKSFHFQPAEVMKDIVDENTGEIIVGWRHKYEEDGDRSQLHKCFENAFNKIMGNITDYEPDGFGMFSVLFRDVLTDDKLKLNSNCIMQSILEMYFLFRLRFSNHAVKLRIETPDNTYHPYYNFTQEFVQHPVSHWASQLGNTTFRDVYKGPNSFNKTYKITTIGKVLALLMFPLVDIYNVYVPSLVDSSYLHLRKS